MRGAVAARERILLATGASLFGLLAVLSVVPPLLSGLSQGGNLTWLVYAVVLFIIPLGLLVPAAIWPRSVLAAVGAALVVAGLLIWGMSVQPMSWPRFVLHLIAILCLAALVSTVIRGVAGRRYRVLWIVPSLLLGFAIAYLAGGLMGLHIVTQFCDWPLLGREISSILCSG
jgi:hypothetical protein